MAVVHSFTAGSNNFVGRRFYIICLNSPKLTNQCVGACHSCLHRYLGRSVRAGTGCDDWPIGGGAGPVVANVGSVVFPQVVPTREEKGRNVNAQRSLEGNRNLIVGPSRSTFAESHACAGRALPVCRFSFRFRSQFLYIQEVFLLLRCLTRNATMVFAFL